MLEKNRFLNFNNSSLPVAMSFEEEQAILNKKICILKETLKEPFEKGSKNNFLLEN